MRPKIIAGNWKMNMGPADACAYFKALQAALEQAGNRPIDSERVIFPPAYCLGSEVQWLASKCNLSLGAQNAHWADQGAFTGELSPRVLKNIGIQWALVAHSERRQYFGETDETAGKRLEHALKSSLRIVFCIGESLAEREAAQTEKVLASQLESYVAAVARHAAHGGGTPRQAAIAYEPVWAIGTGKTATVEQATAAHAFIRASLASKLGAAFAEQAPLLYGGSVTPENAASLLSAPDIDGVLVGGASLKPESFAKILLACY